ncbi:sensor histidine kinase [Paenibacillus sp. GCM10027626]|uniref:cache domain-containing sensor histidine kinase n=1 Tax=Paenibacillus sp. GCM10027626 TaxID=3273411 RepID=UPI00362FF899
MMSRRNGSLRTSLSLSFMIMSMAVLVVSAVMIYFGVLDILQKRSEQSTLRLFQQLENSVEASRQEVDKVSKLFLLDPGIQEYLDVSTSSPADSVNLTNKVMERTSIILKNYEHISSIYLFTNFGTVVGVDAHATVYLTDAAKQHWFYVTSLYNQAQEAFPRLIWLGATKAKDFQNYVYRPEDELPVLLSSMRGVKSIMKNDQAGTLVVNMNQQVLAATYNKLSGEPGSEMYIYDQKGIIISHTDTSRLGQKVPDSLLDRVAGSFGSFSAEDMQAVYYRLGDTGWTVIKLVPISEFVKDIWTLRYTMIGIITVALAAALLISYYWIRKLTKPLKQLSQGMLEMEKGNLGIKLNSTANNELGMLARGFNRMSESISNLIDENRRAEEQKAKLEIRMLQSQIQPHFLYNTLNTIKWMAVVIKADNIAGSLTTLASLLKPIFNRSDLMWTFREETGYIDNYVKLMNMRYGGGIQIEWQLNETILHCQVLRFILQPIVENAIIHGIEAKNYTGSIHIAAAEKEGTITLAVSDTGGGMTAERLHLLRNVLDGADSPTFGIGLQNVNKRIQLHFGPHYRLEADSSPGEGTTITLKFPKIEHAE